MRNVVLVELAKQWTLEAQPKPGSDPLVVDKDTEISDAMARATRETKRECADTLLTLISVMPDQ